MHKKRKECGDDGKLALSYACMHGCINTCYFLLCISSSNCEYLMLIERIEEATRRGWVG